MIEFGKMNMMEKQSLKLNLADNLYVLKLDSKIIGYGKFNDNYNNRIDIYIEKAYRGNGYGKLLFSRMIEEVKTLNVHDINIIFDKRNIQMKKIVSGFGGKLISIDDDMIKYILPIRA